MNWRDHIAVNPAVQVGKPLVKGTRLAVDFLVGLFAAGWSEKDVLENFPALTPEALRAAFAFAAETISDEALHPRQPFVAVGSGARSRHRY